jgi:hypothetical protein
MRKLLGCVLAALALMPFAIRPSAADEHGHGHDAGHGHVYGWQGDIRHFHEHDIVRWRGGRWFHGPHGGRAGWWWIVGPTWYFYPAPVYPFPDPYLPPVAAGPPPAPPASQVWYYCPDPPGYYPYVPQCRTSWQPVPATAYAEPLPG